MSGTLLLAKVSLLGILGGYLPLFLGVPRYRRAFAVLLVASTIALFFFAGAALQTTVDLDRFTSRPPLIAMAAIVVLVAIAAATWAAYRWPVWSVPVMLAVMPIRIPISTGDSSANLLVPLYVVIVAVLVAEVVIRDRLRPPSGRSRDPLRVSLAVLIALAAISIFWVGLDYGPETIGPDWREQSLLKPLIQLLAFYLPFGAVLLLTWRYVANAAGLRRLLLTVIGTGVVLAVIGAVQYPTHWIFFNRTRLLGDYLEGRQFRVNSLFYDPNMLSRMLIMVLILSVVLMVVMPAWRRWLTGIVFMAAAVNVLTLSRSGWIALAAGLVVFAFAWLGRRRGLLVAGAAVALVIVGLGLLVAARGVKITGSKLAKPWGWNHLTGGRFYLGEAALKMAADHPLTGVGLSGFQLAYSDSQYRNYHAYKKLTASHTTPLTMVAELGIPGLLVYAAVVWTALAMSFRRRGEIVQSAPARAGPGAGVGPAGPVSTASHSGVVAAVAGGGGAHLPAGGNVPAPATLGGAPCEPPTHDHDARALYLVRAGLGSVVVALVVHSLLYNAFFEDPYLWAVFGMIIATAYRLNAWQPPRSGRTRWAAPALR